MKTKIIYSVVLMSCLMMSSVYSQNNDTSRKTIIIVADNDGTEIFDMMAPFYAFSATGKANVYIVAEHKSKVIVNRGLYILPHFTFKEIDSLHINADVLVVPNQSRAFHDQKKATLNFIKQHYTGTNRILSVCDGSATVAATGLYDGKKLTTHSSDYEGVKRHYKKPLWTLGTTITKSDNLFSTAGVSNATEGALTVINELFGRDVMEKVMSDIQYPASEIRTDHRNMTVTGNPIFADLRKGKIKRTERVGVLLQEDVNEFDLAAILDCYYRTFPSSINTYTTGAKSVTSKFGLTLLPSGDVNTTTPTELHVLMPGVFSKDDQSKLNVALIVNYESREQYIIDACLQQIGKLYGNDYLQLVKLMLDYNY